MPRAGFEDVRRGPPDVEWHARLKSNPDGKEVERQIVGSLREAETCVRSGDGAPQPPRLQQTLICGLIGSGVTSLPEARRLKDLQTANARLNQFSEQMPENKVIRTSLQKR